MSVAPPGSWVTAVGDIATRKELAALYGGSLYSGIANSKQTPNVLIYSDPAQGKQHGYVFDGASAEGDAFYYTGHGQEGDQQLSAPGNAAILHHVRDGRALRLFAAVGVVPGTNTKAQQYLGEFRVDPDDPWRREPDIDRNGVTRTVIVFRLLPVGDAVLAVPGQEAVVTKSPQQGAYAVRVKSETHSTTFYETSGREPATAQRAEGNLVQAFQTWKGDVPLERWAITIPGEKAPFLTDIYDPETQVLYEAKAASSRNNIRMAIGQLADYKRHIDVDSIRCAVLLPEPPTADLLSLLMDNNIIVAYPHHEKGFEHIFPDGR